MGFETKDGEANALQPEKAAVHEGEESLAGLIDDIVAGKQSVMELLGDVPDGDYWTAVQKQHLFMVLTSDLRVAKILLEELKEEISRRGGSDDSIPKELAFKDGHRRFDLLSQNARRRSMASHSFYLGRILTNVWHNT